MAKISVSYSALSGKTSTDHAPCNTRVTCTHKKHGFKKSLLRAGKWPRKFVVAGRVYPV